MPTWIVSLPDRLDTFLSSDGRMISRAKAQKAIDDGRVKVNDHVVTKQAMRLQEGDTVSLEETEVQANAGKILPKDLELEILYEDDVCLVINKPAGISVHPGAGSEGEPTILHGIAHIFKKKKIPFSSEAVLVHRLDKDTTGCLLIAKDPATHRVLQAQFESRTVKKTYLALVAGIPKDPTATIDAPIGRSTSNRTKMSILGASAAREAQTTYRTLGTTKNVALLECDLHTGRTHQIRVHLSGIGHPVLGDSSYVNALSERLTEEFEIQSICLHAWKLQFVSPHDLEKHPLQAPIPPDMEKVLKRVGIEKP